MKNLPEDLKNKYPEVEWRKVAGMRDRLIHGYFDIDYKLVWDVVLNKIPELKKKIKKILSDFV